MIGRQLGSGRFRRRELLGIGTAQAEIETGHSLLDEVREIFRGGDRLGGHNFVFSERGFQRRSEPLGQCGIVVNQVRAFVAFHPRFAGSAGCSGLCLGDAVDGGKDLGTHFRLECAYRQPHFCLIGNDVVFRSGLYIADCHHGHFARLDFAGDNRLQRENGTGRNHDGIDRGVRGGAMPAFAVNRDAHGIRIGVVDAGSDRGHSRRQFVAHVQSHRHIRLGESGEQSVAYHALRAADGFLSGLANQEQRSVPCILAVRHDLGCTQNCRHVQIVPAGVHHRNVATGVVCGAHFAGVGKAGFFFDGERIQFGAQHDGRARSVLEYGHYSGAAHPLGDLISGAAPAGGKLGRSLCFMRRQFGVLMQIEVERVSVRIDAVEFFRRRSLCAGNGGEQGRR